MYLDWVLTIVAIFLIVFLLYTIYQLYDTREGFALVQTPQQIYQVPILKGVSGRYVRIRPSLTGDGYLTISQIQVIDINGENIALKKAVTATSSGGSTVDKMFGRVFNAYGFNEWRNSVSDYPSCVVDGVLEPRNTLENVFETGVQNTSSNDTQYLEIDLSGNNIISSINYIGQGDAQTRTIYDINSIPYNLTQVDRRKGMRVEIRDTLGILVFGGVTKEAQFTTTDVKQTMQINNQMFTVNAGLGSSAPMDTISIPNLDSYKKFADVFRKATPLIPLPTATADVASPDYIPLINPSENNKELIKALYDTTYKSANITIDLSNNIFAGVVTDYPISFYNDFYLPVCSGPSKPAYCRASTTTAAVPPIPIPNDKVVNIFGTASQTAKDEMRQSIEICKKLYVGSQTGIESYVRIKHPISILQNAFDEYTEAVKSFLMFTDRTKFAEISATYNTLNSNNYLDQSKYLPYLRGECSTTATQPKLGVPDIVNVFSNGTFITKSSTKTNQTWNEAQFKCPVLTSTSTTGSVTALTSTILGLIPLGSRQFLVEWIYNRMQRYRKFAEERDMDALDAEIAWSSNNGNFSPVRPDGGYHPEFVYNEERDICSLWLSKNTIAERRNIIKNNTPSPTRITNSGKGDAYRGGYCPNIRAAFPNAAAESDAHYARLASMTAIQKIVIPSYIDVRSTVLMDSLAQQFYELLDGSFAMAYIYDAFPLGSTMLDVRFQLFVHDDVASSYGPINDLTAQYRRIISATKQTQDVLDEAEYDYESKRFDLEQDAINSVLKPFEGAVVRIFYEKAGSGITIKGLIFDADAVTSFIPEMNGGIPVPLGPSPGNINYEPNILYTKNRVEPLDCRNTDTLKRVMHDYVKLMNDSTNNYPLSKASPPIHVTKGNLVVTQVLGSQQVSETQCAVTWKESLYDSNTNAPMPLPLVGGSGSGSTSGSASGSGSNITEVTRNGLLSYTKDASTWFSHNLTPDISGFKLFPSATVPECKFNPEYYRSLYPNRYSSSATAATIIKDFVNNDFNNGRGPVCPDAIPRYIFPSDTTASALQTYMTTNIYNNYVVRPAQGIAALAPITIIKPIPYETTLDNMSDMCPAASCKDLDILYSLVDQYNSDPSLPGTILSVTHAFTPNQYQCDVKVSIQYGGTIQVQSEYNKLDTATGLYKLTPTYDTITKGTIEYKAGSKTGQYTKGSKALPYSGEYKDITLSLNVSLNPKDCTYTLANAGGQNSGYSIQSNTPELYTPMIYSNELIKRNIGKLDSNGNLTLSGQMGSAINTIQTDFTNAQGSTKQLMKSYRMQTYNVAGGINNLKACANKPCSDSSIQNMIKDYFKNVVTHTGEQIDTILRTGSIDGNSCDATFTTTSARSLTNRFLISSACAINGHIGTQDLIGNTANGGVNTPITDAQILDIKKELTTTLRESFIPYKNPSLSAFTNYSPTSAVMPEAIDVRAFGQDSGRNTDYSIKDAQFETPLTQKLPPATKKRKGPAAPPAYKFLRFTPTQTRSPNAATVNVGKFIFFYDDYPLFLKGTVTNPMGTWEGAMKDVIGPDLRPGWSDAHKKSLVFAFRDPIAVDAYSFTTALPEMGIDGDPVSWKLEGSPNGTFWTILDVQKNVKTPVTRFADLDKMYLTPIVAERQSK